MSCFVGATLESAMVSVVAAVRDPCSAVSCRNVVFSKSAVMEVPSTLLDLGSAGSCGDVLFTKTALVEVLLVDNYRGMLVCVVTPTASVPPFPLVLDNVNTLASVFCYWTQRP